MTLTRERRVAATTPGRPATPSTTRSRLLGVLVVAVAAAATVIALVTATTGVGGDSRLHNPTPQGTHLLDGGASRLNPPLGGVENWPMVFSSIFVVVAVVLGLVFARLSWKQRRLHHGLIVFLAVTVLCWLDPPANWVTFTVYDPRFLHFPTTWSWMRLAPTVEPVVVIAGYPMYYFSIALFSAWIIKRFVRPRSRPGSWTDRHPHATYFTVGFLVAVCWDIPTELFMIRADMYFYSQAWGPVVEWGHVHFPVVWGFFTWFSIAVVTMLMYRDDRGRSLMTRVAERFPGPTLPEGPSSARQILAGVLVLSVAYCVPMLLFGTLRASGVTRPNFDQWRFQETKVYDPYGRLAESGVPGPFYR